MELNEAIAAVQSLRNLFRGLEKLDEVLRAAQEADTVIAEKRKLAAEASAQLEEITAKVAEAQRVADRDVAQARLSSANTISGLSEKLTVASQQAEVVKAKLAESVKVAEEQHKSKVEEFRLEIVELSRRKMALVSTVNNLQGQLAILKERAARV
jgi:hypothetical protein